MRNLKTCEVALWAQVLSTPEPKLLAGHYVYSSTEREVQRTAVRRLAAQQVGESVGVDREYVEKKRAV